MRAYGWRREKIHSFLTSAQMEVSAQHHLPASLTTEKESPVAIE
jgi:hypothetical protein